MPGTSGTIYGWTEVMAAQMPQRAIVNGSTPIANATLAPPLRRECEDYSTPGGGVASTQLSTSCSHSSMRVWVRRSS